MTSPRPQHRRSLDRRDKLLTAAARVLLRSGVRALTLDAVAREAGTSKGGLLHHFPNKATLQDAVLDAVIARVRENLAGFVQADPDPHGRRLRAYVNALVVPTEACDLPAILATLLFDPGALVRWQAFSDEWLGPDLEGVDQSRADSVRALADGCWLAVALGLHPANGSGRAATLQRLLRLTLS